jgi:hypothetical protein
MPWKLKKKKNYFSVKCLLCDKYDKKLLRKVVWNQDPYTKFQNHRPTPIFHFLNVYFTNQRILFLTVILL